MTMNFDHLEAFLAVAAHENLTRAARELHNVQSNLSIKIKQLEETLGVDLFIRRHKGMELTPQGSQFVQHARELLSRRDMAVRDMAMNSDTQSAVSIGTQESFLRARMATPLRSMHNKYPATRIDMQMGFSDTILESLTQKEIDIGVTVGTSSPQGFEVILEIPDQLYLVTPRHIESVTKGLLENLSPLHLGEACFFGRSLMGYFDKKGLIVNPKRHLNSLETIMTLIEAGTGVSILPKSFVDMHPRRKQIMAHLLPSLTRFSYFLLAKPTTILPSPLKFLVAEIEKKS